MIRTNVGDALAFVNVKAVSAITGFESRWTHDRLAVACAFIEDMMPLGTLPTIASKGTLGVAANIGRSKCITVVKSKSAFVVILASARMGVESVTCATRHETDAIVRS